MLDVCVILCAGLNRTISKTQHQRLGVHLIRRHKKQYAWNHMHWTMKNLLSEWHQRWTFRETMLRTWTIQTAWCFWKLLGCTTTSPQWKLEMVPKSEVNNWVSPAHVSTRVWQWGIGCGFALGVLALPCTSCLLHCEKPSDLSLICPGRAQTLGRISPCIFWAGQQIVCVFFFFFWYFSLSHMSAPAESWVIQSGPNHFMTSVTLVESKSSKTSQTFQNC